MKTTRLRNSFLLVLTALIWGIAFVAQREGGNLVGPYSFNCIRSLIGSAVLLPVIWLSDRLSLSRKPASREERIVLLKGGIFCGVVLAIASNLQQFGMYLGASAGKAGFLTACYIILVPLFGLFVGKKCTWNIWLGVFFTTCGLYLLCVKESFSLCGADLLLLLCAASFALHILVIDHFSPLTDGVRLSCVQFLVCGILTAVPMLFTECRPGMVSLWLDSFKSINAWIPILYAGVCSCGIAYTLQIIGQQNVHPTIASLLMSLESVFSVLAGWLILKERLSTKELFGCLLVFIAIILAQIPISAKN